MASLLLELFTRASLLYYVKCCGKNFHFPTKVLPTSRLCLGFEEVELAGGGVFLLQTGEGAAAATPIFI